MPPVSVWLLVLPLFAPGGYLLGVALLQQEGCTGTFGVLALGFAAVVARRTFRGDPAGLRLLDLLAGLGGMAAFVNLLKALYVGRSRLAVQSAAVLAWLAAVMVLRTWHETRRWCGELPPADEP